MLPVSVEEAMDPFGPLLVPELPTLGCCCPNVDRPTSDNGKPHPMPKFFLVLAGSLAHTATLVRRSQLLLSAALRHSMRA
jgi:hypothetical protein